MNGYWLGYVIYFTGKINSNIYLCLSTLVLQFHPMVLQMVLQFLSLVFQIKEEITKIANEYNFKVDRTLKGNYCAFLKEYQ